MLDKPIANTPGLRILLISAFLVAAGLGSGSGNALSPPPPLPEDRLIEFYQAMGGDDWFNNEGWLDPDTPVCDWYGVNCRANPGFGFQEIAEIALPDNNLTGTIGNGDAFDGDVFDIPAVAIDLSGNRIEGPLDRIPFWLGRVDLSRNLLTGPLPAARDGTIIGTPPPDFFSALGQLNLSSNGFEGAIPEDWERFEIQELDLSGNFLDGGLASAFAAIGELPASRIDVADNGFSGTVPPEITDLSLLEAVGLNLCWNALDADQEIDEWLAAHHVGGENWRDCQNRSRLPVDTAISGSWFAPERSGEGVSFHFLPGDSALLYSFGFDLDGNQMWMFEIGNVFETHIEWPGLMETRGDFGAGLRQSEESTALRVTGALRADRLGPETFQVEREFKDWRGCPPLEDSTEPGLEAPSVPPCPVSFLSDRLEHRQLTRLAGASCANRHPAQWLSGAWFGTDRSGEGFLIEVIPDGRAVVYWFTYMPDGSGRQAWMMGVGDIELASGQADPGQPVARIDVQEMVRPTGGEFGPGFDPAAIEREVWGRVRLDFFDEDGGEVAWESDTEAFGIGGHSLARLTRPRLAVCQ
ncbi:MAG: hypothetical protein KGY53_02280 [Wenzhouxiangellaceae bacterium]|nr:hypothetical protein [Wenzhouxiangellaceae bacterium]